MNLLAIRVSRPMRMLFIGLFTALLASIALGMANPRPADASNIGPGGGGYSPGPATYLIFLCEYYPGHHPRQVWVEGYNQHATLVSHTFPAYYTYDYPNYWWWLQGSYIWYQTITTGGWNPERVAYINNFGPNWNTQYVLDPDC